jgi:hypothetical protein
MHIDQVAWGTIIASRHTNLVAWGNSSQQARRYIAWGTIIASRHTNLVAWGNSSQQAQCAHALTHISAPAELPADAQVRRYRAP